MFKVNALLKATSGILISGDSHKNIRGISIDTRTLKAGEAFLAIKGNNFDGYDFIAEAVKKGVSCIIVKGRGHPLAGAGRAKDRGVVFIGVKDTIKALGDIAQFQREKSAIAVIAVTGSNGKTTTKEMIARVLSKKFKVLKNEGTKNNHIGLPLSLLQADQAYDFAVLELGTNHPGEIGYLADISRPNIGVITNIAPAHLESFKDLNGVFAEKYTLIERLKKPRIAVLNADEGFLKKGTGRDSKGAVIFRFGIKNKSDFFATDIKILGTRLEFSVYKQKFILNTPGFFNVYNALAAITLGRLFSMEYKDIAAALADFEFPKSRLNFIELDKIKFIDDTYNSNPLSLRQALAALNNLKAKGRKIFVMGDMLELGRREKLFHHQAGEELAKACDVFVAVGRLSKCAATAAANCGLEIKNIFTCASSLEARDILFKKISPCPDDIVLVKGSRLMQMEEIFRK